MRSVIQVIFFCLIQFICHAQKLEMTLARLRTALNAEGGFPTYVVVDVNGKVNSKAITRMQTLDRTAVKKVTGL